MFFRTFVSSAITSGMSESAAKRCTFSSENGSRQFVNSQGIMSSVELVISNGAVRQFSCGEAELQCDVNLLE